MTEEPFFVAINSPQRSERSSESAARNSGAGKYLTVITESEMKPNRAGTGHFLQLTFQIMEGPVKNTLLWARLNLHNPNVTALLIARAELSARCRAIGVLASNDSVELDNFPLVVHVKCNKRHDTAAIADQMKGYAKKEAASGQPQQAPMTYSPA